MLKSYFKLLSLICVSAIMTSCAIGQRFAYHNVDLNLKAQGDKTIAVATIDNREYVQNKEKAESYIGTLRGGYGNPFDVKTESNEAFSNDVTKVVCNSLHLKGIKVHPLFVKLSDSQETIRNLFRKKNTDCLLLIIINDWYTDTYNSTYLTYAINIKIINIDGETIGQASVEGKEEGLGGGPFPDDARKAARDAYKKYLEYLLNDPSILAAMS